MTTTYGNNVGSTQINVVPNPTFVPILEKFTVTTNNTGTVQSTVAQETWVIGESSYMFMRPRVVNFKVEGLKPNTQYYPFFDNVYVGSYCSTVSGAIQSDIYTDALGQINGNFYLPANAFTVGTHTFKLVDNTQTVSGATRADPIYGSVTADYTSKGILKHVQTQVTTSAVDIKVATPTNITLSPLYAQATPPGLTASTATVCQSWYFEYKVVSIRTQAFTVVTSSSSAPINPKPNIGSFNSIVDFSSITFLSTSVDATGLYTHKYSYKITTEATYRQEWIGRTTDTAPSIASFRPSGITANDTITILKQWTLIGKVACPVSLNIPVRVVQVDPLAQSFFIEPAISPNGVYLTSINVYFRKVDQSTPVMLELRDMSNGLPGPNILPGGKVVIPGYATGQSIDGTLATRFAFDQPVYLRPNTEYCFVLKSSSLGYDAWCSRVGEKDVATGKLIDSQPFAGTLFKSENDSTWTPNQLEDIKFELNVARFNTAVEGDLVFKPQYDAVSNNYYSTARTMPLSYMSTTDTSGAVNFNIPQHGLQTSDKVYIVVPTQRYTSPSTTVPITDYHGIAPSNLQGEFVATVVDEDNFTITALNSDVASSTGPVQYTDLLNIINTVPPVSGTDPVIYVGERVVNSNNNSPSTVPSTTSTPTAPAITSAITGNTFTVYTNILASEVMIDYLGTEVAGTSIVENIRMATGQSSSGLETPYTFASGDWVNLEERGNYYKFSSPVMLASPRNESLHNISLGGEKSLQVNLKLQSSNASVSPTINTSGLSLIVKSYKIDNQSEEINALIENPSATIDDYNDSAQNSEIVPGKGNAAAKYKGAVVQTTKPFNTVTLYVTANCPSPAAIDAYVRTSTDAETHIDREWQWMPINGVLATSFSPSSNNLITDEWMYKITNATPASVYDIKLVMRSTNNSIVPKIYGIRAITSVE